MARPNNPNPANAERAAKARKLIIDFLQTVAGQVSSTAILDALEPQLPELGLTRHGVYFHIKALADRGLITVNEDQRTRKFGYKPEMVGPPKPMPKHVIHVDLHEEEHIVKQAHKRAAKASKSGVAGRAAAQAKAQAQREKWDHIARQQVEQQAAPAFDTHAPWPEPERLPFGEPNKSTEVELVVAGVTIVVGRNPVTGRPRITIE